MERVRQFHHDRVVLAPEPGSFTAEGESARWSNKDLDPVKPSRKKWEWYHVGMYSLELFVKSCPAQEEIRFYSIVQVC